MRQTDNLTDLEWRLLEVMSLAADLEYAQVARKLRTPVHRVQYAHRCLVERGIIKGRIAFVDYSRLGRISASSILWFDSYGKKTRDLIHQFVKKEKAISWCSEIVGDGQLAIQTFTRTLEEVRQVLGNLQRSIGSTTVSHKIAIRLRHTSLENRYSTTMEAWLPRKMLYAASGEGNQTVSIDELDRRCLQALCIPNFHSIDSLARALGEPKATVHRRVKRLGESQVIQGYHWYLDQKILRINRYRVLLKSGRIDNDFEENLQKVLHGHARVTNIAVCLGDWDYEFSLEQRQGESVHEVVSDILEKTGEPQNLKYSLYQNVEYVKYSFSGI